jgi:hypothetical protein
VKQKTCKACKQKFAPARPLQSCCSIKCAIDNSNRTKAKQIALESTRKRKEHREAKERIKSRADYLKEAQAAFNRWIRARDADEPCISSGVGNTHYVSGKPKITTWDAGHYRTVGACPELRFCEINVHKQSVHDNQHLHGNIIAYRKGLIERIGLEMVEWLEGPHEPKKFTIEELKVVKAKYSRMVRELEKK